ncbi:hypothetical protein ANN_26109 [Periplaneta americana]|uniref:Ubiquitin carboxyl-terminal hydrolase n=1 Tax=Periplaneta americana TaxID=6978 RepID=A0ABQ8S5A3_PERAM|nr:hypothetical protein ANN_26109 [Periplaneta americana]
MSHCACHGHIHKITCHNHYIQLNLSTNRLWCYQCESEVFLENGLGHSRSNSSVMSPVSTLYSPQTMGAGGESGDSSDSEDSRDDNGKPRGLTGLQNIGNTCYMNSALQALSNTPPLTQFFLDCGTALVAANRSGDKKPGLSRSYHRLVQEMWHRKRPGYVVPSGILYGIRSVHPMFRGYQQHDTQEFLRCFMDQLHEELKEPLTESAVSNVSGGAGGPDKNSQSAGGKSLGSGSLEEISDEDDDQDDGEEGNGGGGGVSSQSEGEYETCDSGVSERSSLSDEGERGGSSGSRSASKRNVSSSQIITTVGTPIGGPNSTAPSSVSAPGSPQRSLLRGKKAPVKHRSIISDVFDGKLLSSVQCLTCDRLQQKIRKKKAKFGKEESPIPSRQCMPTSVSSLSSKFSFVDGDSLLIAGVDEYFALKESNFRGGIKALEHRWTKCISVQGDYIEKKRDCVSQVTSYDLVSVICHHGTAGGGHYTCYSLNCISEQWFEFDDQYVTQVSPESVQNCEAYVLFYKKSSTAAAKLRHRAVELMELSHHEPSLMQFYVSKQWVNKFNTFAEPGPIDNSDFLCIHGGVHPAREPYVNELCTILSQAVWEYLYDTFGGGPACNRLYACPTCQQDQEALARRVKHELEVFMQLNKEFQQAEESPVIIFAIAMSWFRQWQSFVRGKEAEPPGQIDNSSICTINKNGQAVLKMGSDYAQLSEELWSFFRRVYGGGPEVVSRSSCQRTGSISSSSGVGSSLPPPTAARTVSVPPESPVGMAHALKARSTENITSHGGSSGISGGIVRPAGRAQSVSSDNITIRMAALSASGNKPGGNIESKGQETGEPNNLYTSMIVGSGCCKDDGSRIVASVAANSSVPSSTVTVDQCEISEVAEGDTSGEPLVAIN